MMNYKLNVFYQKQLFGVPLPELVEGSFYHTSQNVSVRQNILELHFYNLVFHSVLKIGFYTNVIVGKS